MKRLNYLCLVGLLFVSAASAARGETIEWTRQLGTSSEDESFGVSADGQGNVYISGYTQGSLGGPYAGGQFGDAFVSKYDAAGTLQWTRQLGTSATDRSSGVSADGLGSVYISGRTIGSLGGPNAGEYDAFVSKYDAAGSLQWTRQLGSSRADLSFGVSADGLGNVYLSGDTYGSLAGPSAGDSDAFVSKYDAAGALQWSRQLGTSGADQSFGVSADGLGNVYLLGTTTGSLGGPNAGVHDAFVSKYDAAGTLQWTRQLGTSSTEYSNGVSADALGNVYISGHTYGSLGGPNAGERDAFLSKYDAAGSLKWTRQLGTSLTDASNDVSADGLGNVYISGGTFGSLGGPTAGDSDAFVSKYDAAGTLQWTRQLGTSSSDASLGVSADGLGNIYFSGWTKGSLGGPNAGGDDAFVAKIADPAVPEPSTFLLAAAAIGLCMAQRRRRASQDNPNAARQTRRRQQLSIALVLGLSATLCNSAATAHAATLRTVALTGQQVPGAPDGTVFVFGEYVNPPFGPPVLNDAGQTAFQGIYSNGLNFGEGIFSEGAGSLQLVAAVGQQAPGMPDGVTYANFPSPGRIATNDTGVTAFAARFTPPGGYSDGGIWSIGSGISTLVARTGEQAAGTPAGTFYLLGPDSIGARSFLINDAGQTAFQADIYGSGVEASNNYGIWAQRQGNLELVARTGSPAAGTPAGVNFSDFFSLQFSLNNLSQTAFFGNVTGSGVDATNDSGVWSGGAGDLALVAREGNQTPGMPAGAVFGHFGIIGTGPAFNNAGQTAFANTITGGGVDATNDSGIWLGTAGNLSLAVREGAHAPGTPSDVTFASIPNFLVALNDAGQLTFWASLRGAGVDSTNNFGLWSGAPGSLALVARKGDHAPGTGDGVVFRNLFNSSSGPLDLMLNAAGQTAFFSDLSGSGISASNDQGIWATDRSGALQLVAREGDLLEVAPGDFRTISRLDLSFSGAASYSTGNSDGRPSAFNNRGQLAFMAQFTDGTSGIFVSNRVAVPEPSTLVLAAVALGLCIARRRRKHGALSRDVNPPRGNARHIVGAVFLLILNIAPAASAAPLYNIVPLGLDDSEHTRSDGYQASFSSLLNEAGQVSGSSERYNGGSTYLGSSAWLYNGANTVGIGLTGLEHTRNDGYQVSSGGLVNEAGQVVGYSDRYNGGSADLGRSVWLYDGATTIDLGLVGSEHTRNDGYKYSEEDRRNNSGMVQGFSNRYSGGSADLGRSVWLYNGATTIDLGLTGAEYTRSDGYKYSDASGLNAAGQVIGYSRRYNGGGSQLGQSAWLYDGTTTIDIGLAGPEHTRNDGFKYSVSSGLVGSSIRYNGGSSPLGQSVWLYDGTTTIDIGLTGPEHTRNDGYKFSAGGRFGYSDRYSGGSTSLGSSAWLYDGTTTIEIGLTAAEYTRSDGYKYSRVAVSNGAGQVGGLSYRYNGGSTQLGQSAWLYNGATTIDIGLTGAEHTRNDGSKFSEALRMTATGKATGHSYRYNGGGSQLGQSAWLYDGATTINIGLTDAEHTRNDGTKFSYARNSQGDSLLNAAGQFSGFSAHYNGGSTYLGSTAWLYDGTTTVRIGLTDSDHTRNDGYKSSRALWLYESGQVIGDSERYNGGSTYLGVSPWLYNGATTIELGLSGVENTRNDGYRYSSAREVNAAGQVTGYSLRYNGGSAQMGLDAWFYDPSLDQTFALIPSTRSDGYALSEVLYLGEDGLVLGTYTLFDALDNDLGNRAFYFTIADGLHDLGSFVDGGLAANGWDYLASVFYYGPNGAGQINGQGKLASQSGGQMAYLLTPNIPEPSAPALVTVAVLGFVGCGRFRQRHCAH